MNFAFARYALVGHRTVQGWIEPGILWVLAALAAEQDRRGVRGGSAEIGVHHGRLFIALHMLRDRGTRSVAIDLFASQDANIDRSGRGSESALRRNLRRHVGSTTDLVVLSANSRDVGPSDVRRTLGGGARLFSVDGGHTRDIVEHDLRTAEGSLETGGILIADDVFNEQWPGVQEGTYAFLRKRTSLVPFAIGFNKTLFTSPESAELYLAAAEAVAVRHLWQHKKSSFAGSPVVVFWVPGPITRFRTFGSGLLRANPGSAGQGTASLRHS